MLYKKQFGFQKSYSTEHTVLKLINDVFHALEKDYFTLGIFIDLSKVFDTLDHTILLSKLKHYGIKNNNFLWFQNYLKNRKQYIQYGNDKTNT